MGCNSNIRCRFHFIGFLCYIAKNNQILKRIYVFDKQCQRRFFLLKCGLIGVFCITQAGYDKRISISLYICVLNRISHGEFTIKIVLSFLRCCTDLHRTVVNTSAKTAGIFRSFAPIGANRQHRPITRKLNQSNKIDPVYRQHRHCVISSPFRHSILWLWNNRLQGVCIILRPFHRIVDIPSPQNQHGHSPHQQACP